MEIKEKIIRKIQNTNKHVILRCEFDKLGSRTQVTEALNLLILAGRLDRIGKGIYENKKQQAKPVSNEYIILLVTSVFKELGVTLCGAELQEKNSNRLCIVRTSNPRTSRKLVIHGTPIVYTNENKVDNRQEESKWIIPNNIDELPTSNVKSYIERLAKHYKIKHQRSKLDEYAEAVTRMAGDEVRLDATESLLVTLKKKNLIDARQLSRLLSNYLKEISNVRPIRRLRDSRLPAQH